MKSSFFLTLIISSSLFSMDSSGKKHLHYYLLNGLTGSSEDVLKDLGYNSDDSGYSGDSESESYNFDDEKYLSDEEYSSNKNDDYNDPDYTLLYKNCKTTTVGLKAPAKEKQKIITILKTQCPIIKTIERKFGPNDVVVTAFDKIVESNKDTEESLLTSLKKLRDKQISRCRRNKPKKTFRPKKNRPRKSKRKSDKSKRKKELASQINWDLEKENWWNNQDWEESES